MMTEFYGPEASKRLQNKFSEKGAKDLSQAEEAAFKKRAEAIDKLFAEQGKAKYRIEIQFSEKRSTWKPFTGVMYYFMNGNRFHGGGDDKIYLCSTEDCHAVVDVQQQNVVDLNEDPLEIRPAKILCHKCDRIVMAADLWGERILRLTPQDWARAIELNFNYLGGDSDIRLIFHHSEIQVSTYLDMEKGGGRVDDARRYRERVLYPLKNILQDLHSGADLYSRFLALMKS